MDLQAVQDSLRAWVQRLAVVNGERIPLEQVTWQNEPRVYSNGLLAILSWVSRATVGNDEIDWKIDPTIPAPGSNATAVTVTQRKLVLQVSFETQSQFAAENSAAWAEEFRGRVYSQSSVDRLANAKLGLIDAGDAKQSDYRVQQRWISRTLVEVSFNHTDSTVDDDSLRGTIEHVQVTSQFQNQTDTNLPAAEQLANVEWP